MARIKLRDDATINDVLPTLNKPADYVRGIVGSMAAYQRANGACIVRIGTTGHGRQPNYRLEPEGSLAADFKESFPEFLKVAAFNGSSHKQVWDMLEIKGDHWSRGFLKFEEVQTILGRLRNFDGKPRPRD